MQIRLARGVQPQFKYQLDPLLWFHQLQDEICINLAGRAAQQV
jgi:hypothetical protein